MASDLGAPDATALGAGSARARPAGAVPPPRPPLVDHRDALWDNRRWKGFRLRPGDVLVCTPPKCGTTWVQAIVAQLLFPDGRLPDSLIRFAPWLEARFAPRDRVVACLEAQQHRRQIKTHSPAEAVPWNPDASYIVVGRDGRDTFLSACNHVRSMRPDLAAELAMSAMAEGIELAPPPPMDDDRAMLGWWMEHGGFFRVLTSYWALRDQPNVLFVHYDDLKQDLAGQVQRMTAFLGLAIAEEQLPAILQRCSFEWMKANAEQFADFGELFVQGAESFFHRGVAGRWRSELSDDDLREYDRRSRELLPPELKAWLDRGDRQPLPVD